MVFIKKIKSGSKTYYYLVRSYRIGNRVYQDTIKRLSPNEARNPNFISEFLLNNPKYQNTGIKAIIPAAGKSIRLFPYSQDLPKGLIPIDKKPILQHIIESLHENGVSDLILITGFQNKILERQFKSEAKVLYNPFFSVSGILASLWFAIQEMNTTLLILYSDLLFNEIIIKELLKDESDICIAVSDSQTEGVTEKAIVTNNLIQEIGPKVTSDIERVDFAGIAKFSPDGALLLQRIIDEMSKEEGFLNYYFSDALERLILKGYRITAKKISFNEWIDINTPRDLQRAERFIYQNILSSKQNI